MGEISAWTVAVGMIPHPIFSTRKTRKDAKAALDFIEKLEGFIGFCPVGKHGTLCIFRTENDAKIARNRMNVEGINTGVNICEVKIDDMYVKK